MKRLLKAILKVAFTLLTSVLGTLLAVIIVLCAIRLYYYHRPIVPKLEPKTILTISLDGQLEEEVPQYIFPFYGKKNKHSVDLLVIKKALLAAQSDDRIAGVYLKAKNLVAGWVLLSELRTALQNFKESKKFIFSYAESYSPKTYYATSLADEIALHPEGAFVFKGLSMNLQFYKGLLDKLEIKPEIFKVGRYKSAVEPFTSFSMSPDSKEQTGALLNAFYSQFINTISIARNIPPRTLYRIANQLSVTNPKEAKDAGLITQLSFFNEFEDCIKLKLGLEEGIKVSYIDYGSYYQFLNAKKKANHSQEKVTVVLATGNIVNSSQPIKNEISATKFVKILRNLREDKSVKAIVIRINSSGGSSLASSTIWKEVMLTKAVKPVVTSMADLAASGAYYVAMASHYVMAHPMTITGSIGIFALYFDLHKGLKNKLGISFDGVKTTPSGDLWNPMRPLTEHERKVIQKNIDQGYASFVDLVGTSRNKDSAEIHAVAQGRVWLADIAKNHGLIDELGGLEDAIQKAAALANLKEYQVAYSSQHVPSLVKEIINFGSFQSSVLDHSGLQSYKEEIRLLVQLQGVQYALPYAIDIQ